MQQLDSVHKHKISSDLFNYTQTNNEQQGNNWKTLQILVLFVMFGTIYSRME